jgi:hypothetical protein
MTIVTNRGPHRKRPAKAAQPVDIKLPRIVEHESRRKRKQTLVEGEVSPETWDFFRRMGIKVPSDD